MCLWGNHPPQLYWHRSREVKHLFFALCDYQQQNLELIADCKSDRHKSTKDLHKN